MPLATNNSRPSLPYQPAQSLPNNQRFGLLGHRPPTAEMLDAEFNSLQDDINLLAQGINEVEAGSIPGASDPLNANKVLKTDGQGNLSFILINNAQMAAGSVVEAALAPQSVTTSKLGDGSVNSAKLGSESVANRHLQANCVTTDEIVDGAITHQKIAPLEVETEALNDLAVTTDKLADNSVTTPKLVDQCITREKIANAAVSTLQLGLSSVTTNELASSAVTNAILAPKAVQISNIDAQGASSSTVLMSQGSGNVSFNKISGSSFDGSLIQDGAVLGSLNGYALAPVGGLIFCIFQIRSGSGSSLQWKGFNVRTATCVAQGFDDEYLVTVTYRRRAPTPDDLICFIASNIYTPAFTATGFTYITPGNNTASYLALALLPDGN